MPMMCRVAVFVSGDDEWKPLSSVRGTFVLFG